VRLAILIPAADYPLEWRWAYDVEAAALTAAGAEVEPVVWNSDREPDGFDLVLPLVAWGYHKDYSRWLGLLERLERSGARVENPIPLLRWNGDKAYLAELGALGVPTVPTIVVETLDEAALACARDFFCCADVVVKPPVSASAHGAFRLGKDDPFPEPVRGRRMLAQPWIESITSTGEYSLIFFSGVFSHAVSKVPVPGEFRVQPEYGGVIARCDPPPEALAVALAALSAAPAPATYARVDVIAGNNGEFQLIELELIEPALFLAQAPEAAPLFATAVLAAASQRLDEEPLAYR